MYASCWARVTYKDEIPIYYNQASWFALQLAKKDILRVIYIKFYLLKNLRIVRQHPVKVLLETGTVKWISKAEMCYAE